MAALRSTSDFVPLLKALRHVESRLQAEGQSRVLRATQTVEEFKCQELEPHQSITERPLRGPRILVRDRRRVNQSRIEAARWPEEKMHELVIPALNIVLSGQADMRIANYSVKCQPGDVLFIPVGLPRSDGSGPDYVEVTPTSSCDILLFSPGLVSGLGLECSIGHSRGNKHIAGSVDERCWVKNVLIAQLYSSLCEEVSVKGNTKSTFHLLMLLLIELQQEIKDGKAMVGWPFSTLAQPKVEEDLIRRAMKYINDHLEDHLTIDIVAHEVGVSRVILTREFRRATSDTFKKYLINQRIKRAEIFLKEANLPVNRTSAQVGLSPCQLRRLFRERHQCSPDEFRSR